MVVLARWIVGVALALLLGVSYPGVDAASAPVAQSVVPGSSVVQDESATVGYAYDLLPGSALAHDPGGPRTQGALLQAPGSANSAAVPAVAVDGAATTFSVPIYAPSAAARFGGHSADDLVRGASAARGDYTAAGHALTKHAAGQRGGSSAFPSLSGNPANINRIAQGQIDDILANGRVVTRTHPNHGPIVEIFAPDGRGARWYADGRFFGFLEP